jgi:uncharacterized membrane protein YqaE (UPF0057 family)
MACDSTNLTSVDTTLKLLILEYNGCNYIIKLPYHTRTIPLRTLITTHVARDFDGDLPYFYTVINGKLTSLTVISWRDLQDITTIKLHFPLYGGGGGFIDTVIDTAQAAGRFAGLILEFIKWFGYFIAWLAQIFYWIIAVLNPITLLSDFANTIMMISNSLVIVPLQAIVSFIKLSANNIFGKLFGSFWGWDNATNGTSGDNDDARHSRYMKEHHGRLKCYAPNQKVPISVLLGTIICPPIGVFMDLGFTGWLHILLATLLTFAYYLPGLLYALLIIYS